MKKNKIDSEILDDSYFPKKEKPKYTLLKIVGFTLINIFSFFLIGFSVILVLWFIFGESASGSMQSEKILNFFLVNHLPFIIPASIFGIKIRKNNSNNQFEKAKWKYWVIILSFFFSLIFRSTIYIS